MSGTLLADYCSSIDYGYTASACDDPAGPRFLRITDIVAGTPQWEQVLYCEADEKTVAKFRLNDGDIVVARTGATTGVSTYIQKPPAAVFASYLVRLVVDANVADARFTSYYLMGPQFWGYMRGVLGDKSAQPNASAKTITQAPATFPGIGKQRAIAGVLGALDDKIEQNRRLARAIFRAWFVDFEPVKAKATGVTAKGGGTPSTKNQEYWDGGEHWWATPKDMSRLSHPVLLDTERRITDAGVDSISSGILPVGTVLMSSRAPVGYLAIAGVPTFYVIAAYQQAADPLFDLLTACVRENERLAEMRDYLLPKLLSGTVRVEHAAGTLEDTA